MRPSTSSSSPAQETDFCRVSSQDQEFRAWLVGEKMINPETLSKKAEKQIFSTFVEEYNTGTLPHDKYYDLSKYEARMTALRMGETVQSSDVYDPNKDLEGAPVSFSVLHKLVKRLNSSHVKFAAVRASHKRVVVETETYLDRGRLESLRKVQNERVEMERMMKLGMKVPERMGVRLETNEERSMAR